MLKDFYESVYDTKKNNTISEYILSNNIDKEYQDLEKKLKKDEDYIESVVISDILRTYLMRDSLKEEDLNFIFEKITYGIFLYIKEELKDVIDLIVDTIEKDVKYLKQETINNFFKWHTKAYCGKFKVENNISIDVLSLADYSVIETAEVTKRGDKKLSKEEYVSVLKNIKKYNNEEELEYSSQKIYTHTALYPEYFIKSFLENHNIKKLDLNDLSIKGLKARRVWNSFQDDKPIEYYIEISIITKENYDLKSRDILYIAKEKIKGNDNISIENLAREIDLLKNINETKNKIKVKI